ncbi:MAG: hypothetical protein OXQ90_20600 [Gammaproteobacteria bacterium]|nr:hypothetical protein [Gammaproteobacteria bacterium]
MSEYERQYEDGSDPRVLDIVDVPVLDAAPKGYQSENWLLDSRYYWSKAGAFSPFELERLLDPPGRLWINGHHTFNGSNDKVPEELMRGISSSLRLIRVATLELCVFAPGEAFGNSKRRVQGRFEHAGHHYALWITDPVYERGYLAKLDGTYEIGPCYLTVSIGEPYDGSCYKLLAAVIEPESA